MPLIALPCEYSLCALFAQIRHDFTLGQLCDYTLKTKPKHNKTQTDNMFLGYTLTEIGLSVDTVSLGLHALQVKWNKTKKKTNSENKAF